MSTTAPDGLDVGELEPRGHTGGALDLHPYFGRVDPALAHALIHRYSHAGDLVLDPFCGSGTVLHEALATGRSAIGWDSSPLATGISLAKLSTPSGREIAATSRFGDSLTPWSAATGSVREAVSAEATIPEMPRVQSVSSWFGEVPLRELAFIRHLLLTDEGSMPKVSRLLAWIAFSRIITRASNQQGESSYRRVTRDHSPGDVISLFQSSVAHVVHTAGALSRAFGARIGAELNPGGGRFSWRDRSVTITTRDARHPTENHEVADLVVTSPPYLMSWDYGLYHKFRFYWLGLDLDQYEETEIGRHLRRQRDDVERYRTDMTATFAGLATCISPSGRIAMINSPSVVYGQPVDTNVILTECAQESGWQLEDCRPSLRLTGPHHGMYASLKPRRASAPGRAGKQEHVLVFTRAAY